MACLFGTSGIRRKVGELPSGFCVNLGRALGSLEGVDTVAVGRDTRDSGPLLQSSFISGLVSAGKDVVDVGVVPTPTVGVATAEYGTGVTVTASHNPADYNGFKFWDTTGAFNRAREEEVEALMESKSFREASPGSQRKEDFIEKHVQLILEKVGGADGVRVLVDCAGGSGSLVTPRLLESMGCSVTVVNDNRDGVFPHPLEPTAENLVETCRLVADGDFDVAFAHDGDADRTCAINSDGELVEWDSFLSVLAYGLDTVVTTVDASMRIEDVCKRVVRCRVGDVFVADAVRRNGADFGGEPSGTFIFPDVHIYPDGIATAAKAVKLVAEGRFYDLLSEIKSYPMTRLKIPCPDGRKQEVMEKLKELITVRYNDIDGIRVEEDDAWSLLRPSGTEAFMRITAEGRTQKDLDGIVERSRQWLEEAMR